LLELEVVQLAEQQIEVVVFQREVQRIEKQAVDKLLVARTAVEGTSLGSAGACSNTSCRCPGCLIVTEMAEHRDSLVEPFRFLDMDTS
jgi:hypothetical protein